MRKYEVTYFTAEEDAETSIIIVGEASEIQAEYDRLAEAGAYFTFTEKPIFSNRIGAMYGLDIPEGADYGSSENGGITVLNSDTVLEVFNTADYLERCDTMNYKNVSISDLSENQIERIREIKNKYNEYVDLLENKELEEEYYNMIMDIAEVKNNHIDWDCAEQHTFDLVEKNRIEIYEAL